MPSRAAWRPRRFELAWLAAAVVLALAVFTYALVRCLGDLIMTRKFLNVALVAAAAVAALSLAGCAIPGMPGGSSAGHEILQNLQGCTRHYEGAIGAGVNGSFRIDCQPAAGVTPGALVGIPVEEDPGLAVAPSNRS